MSQLNQYLISLDKYSVIQHIGEGAYFTVFLVEDKETKKKYAAKIGKFNDESSREKCLQSIEIMGQNRHQTLVNLIGYSPIDFEGDENLTIILDYESNGDLQRLIKKGELTTTQKQIILVGICRAMMLLHSKNIIHRDIKPENVVIDEQFKPHLTGLILATKITERSELEYQCGTPLYMAPEMIEGDGEYGLPVDAFSFAILLYQVVLNVSPQEIYGRDKIGSIFKLLNEIRNGLRPQFNSQIKPSLKDMIEHCWSQKPSDRFTFEQLFQKLAYDPEYYIDDDVDGNQVKSYADSIKQ